MPRTAVAPTEHRDGEKVTLTHPAFGQVTVFKQSGDFPLYGSNIVNPQSISLRIHHSELQRRYSHDRYSPETRPFVEVRFSLAQWAEMLSSIGNGEGTPCTLVSKDGVTMPEIIHENRAKEFTREGKEAIDGVMQHLKALREDVASNTVGASKGKQAALLARVEAAMRSISDSLPFIQDQFTEHMEREVSQAAIEINAMAQRHLGAPNREAIEGGSQNR